jgi:hypothetical protein
MPLNNRDMQPYTESGHTNELQPYHGFQSGEAAQIPSEPDLFSYEKTWEDRRTCEGRGFFGFASMGEVIDYLQEVQP